MCKDVKMFSLQTYANEESEVKTCTGNGLLDILGLVIQVIVYGGGYTVTYLIIKTSSYQTHVILSHRSGEIHV